MKLYIKNYNIQTKAENLKEILKKHCTKKKESVHILSDKGMFTVTDKKLQQHHVVENCHAELVSNNNKWNFILDKSETQTTTVYQIPFNHLKFKITTHSYSLSNSIQLVIQETFQPDTNKNVVTDFYFDISNKLNESEIINNDELNVFLSTLN
jgi:hypothetical protein